MIPVHAVGLACEGLVASVAQSTPVSVHAENSTEVAILTLPSTVSLALGCVLHALIGCRQPDIYWKFSHKSVSYTIVPSLTLFNAAISAVDKLNGTAQSIALIALKSVIVRTSDISVITSATTLYVSGSVVDDLNVSVVSSKYI
jgi:hypothetical protein